jgi:enterochelin esterase family protein
LTPQPFIERVPPATDLNASTLEDRLRQGQAFPIVTPEACTFAYCGPVISVRLVHFGVGFPDDLSFAPVGESGWWLLSLAVPERSRLEYKLEVVDSFGTRLVEDPLNPTVASHPFGANSVCEAHGYVVPDWAVFDPEVPAGDVVDLEIDSGAFGRRMTASVYRPSGFPVSEDARYPLLIVHDGGDYLAYASAKTVLDNLIGRGEMPPIVAAFIHPGERLVEYADDPRHAAFVGSELVPALEKAYPLVGTPGARCLMGCSFGAVASLSAAWHAPTRFGRLLCQSGSFAGAGHGCRPRPEPLWEPVRQFVQAFLAEPTLVAERVFVSCGTYESLICENRGLVPELERTGATVRFVESPDGHNWACWRDSLGIALPWLFA